MIQVLGWVGVLLLAGLALYGLLLVLAFAWIGLQFCTGWKGFWR